MASASFVVSQGRLDVTFNSPAASLSSFDPSEWFVEQADGTQWSDPTGYTIAAGGVLRVTGFSSVAGISNQNRFRKTGGGLITLENTTSLNAIDWTPVSLI